MSVALRISALIAAAGALAGCAPAPTPSAPVVRREALAQDAAPDPAPEIVPLSGDPSGDRPLFKPLVGKAEPLRSAPPLSPRPTPAPPRVAPSPVTVTPVEEPALSLVGVMQDGETPVALIRQEGRSSAHRVRRGDEVAGERVQSITGDEVVLARGGRSRTLHLDATGPQVEIIGQSSGFTAAERDAIEGLPWRVGMTAANIIPKGGDPPRVRTDRDDGQIFYEIEKRVDGLDWEIRIAQDGRVESIERDLRLESLPALVTAAANRAIPGYEINRTDTPKLLDRDGTRYYVIELREIDGRQEVDLRIAPDGRVIGRN
jgi:hypothetical protein